MSRTVVAKYVCFCCSYFLALQVKKANASIWLNSAGKYIRYQSFILTFSWMPESVCIPQLL